MNYELSIVNYELSIVNYQSSYDNRLHLISLHYIIERHKETAFYFNLSSIRFFFYQIITIITTKNN